MLVAFSVALGFGVVLGFGVALGFGVRVGGTVGVGVPIDIAAQASADIAVQENAPKPVVSLFWISSTGLEPSVFAT